MDINITDLIKIIDSVLEKCVLNNGAVIETDEDNFWYIDTVESVDFSKEPGNICVGSLVDDYASLETLISEARDVNILDLDRIANVLKFVSLEIEKNKNKHL